MKMRWRRSGQVITGLGCSHTSSTTEQAGTPLPPPSSHLQRVPSNVRSWLCHYYDLQVFPIFDIQCRGVSCYCYFRLQALESLFSFRQPICTYVSLIQYSLHYVQNQIGRHNLLKFGQCHDKMVNDLYTSRCSQPNRHLYISICT